MFTGRNHATAKRLAPVRPRVKPTEWVIRTDHETRRFTSLSQMASSLSSKPIRDDEIVTLERNGLAIHQGPWGEGLHTR